MDPMYEALGMALDSGEKKDALIAAQVQEIAELRAELAEWRAHDCRNIARGFDFDGDRIVPIVGG